MVKTIRTSLVSSFVSSLLLALLVLAVLSGSLSAYAEEEQATTHLATIHLEPSVKVTTAGQQIELALTARYNEGVEVIFNPQQQNWGAMELLTSHTALPRWVDGQWQYTVYMDTAFLIPDQHQTPVFTVDVFRGSEHWQMQTPSLPVEVLSSFDKDPVDIQDTVELPGRQEASTYNLSLLLALAALVVLASAWFIRQRRQPALVGSSPLLSAKDLAEQAGATDSMDWEALRQWLMVTTGADPTGKLTTDDPLLHRYQSLRFGRETQLPDFIDYCHHCQEKWG
ncbi:hypothetical protein [Endozoicomonas lisbonensis]|uniref:Protein BatD n=1 Tax=Endozoicomonas lisbonensis TaxID=3120522 RepID=A0ABV2SL57_9GAMM